MNRLDLGSVTIMHLQTCHLPIGPRLPACAQERPVAASNVQQTSLPREGLAVQQPIDDPPRTGHAQSSALLERYLLDSAALFVHGVSRVDVLDLLTPLVIHHLLHCPALLTSGQTSTNRRRTAVRGDLLRDRISADTRDRS